MSAAAFQPEFPCASQLAQLVLAARKPRVAEVSLALGSYVA